MDINLIGVPTFYGSDIEGVEFGPDKLREIGVKEILEKNNTTYDLGNIYVDKCKAQDKFNLSKKAKYLDSIIKINNNLSQCVYLSLKNDNFPIILGGDHSLALGSIAASSKYFGDDLAVIWIDAHGDFNTIDTTLTCNVHGMPLAASAGIGDERLTNLYFNGSKVKFKNIFIVAARDLDFEEEKLIKKNKVNLWSSRDIKELGVDKIAVEIIKKLQQNNINNIHISFDIDSIDPKFIPATGTKVKDGIDISDSIKLLEYIFESKKVRSLDVVEFNPIMDISNKTQNNLVRIFDKISFLIGKL